jgi:two-component system OmpR family response regulator
MSTERYRFDNLTIDLEAYHLMHPDGTVIDLTYQEQRLLRVLIEARGRALSVAELGRLALGWPSTYASPSSLRNCLCRLRGKLGTHAHLLTTIRNAGYRVSPHIRPDTDVSLEALRSTP